jgi:hypothetical protein
MLDCRQLDGQWQQKKKKTGHPTLLLLRVDMAGDGYMQLKKKHVRCIAGHWLYQNM